MYYTLHYKSYKGSFRATIISFFSGLLKLISAASIIGFICMIIRYTSENNSYIITLGITFLASLTLGKVLEKLADKIGKTDFEKKIRGNLNFTISMGKENPKAKTLYMQLNPQYADYLLSKGEAIVSEDGNIIVNSLSEDTLLEKSKKPIKLTRVILIVLFAAIVPICFIYFLSHNFSANTSTPDTNVNKPTSTSAVNNSKSTSSGDESKYPTYVKLNNDILWRYDASVTTYVEEFGKDDIIVFRRGKNNISGITPVIDPFYKELDKFKEKAESSPKTDVDESALKLIGETKTMYDTIGEVAAYYNDGGYKNDNLARAQEIHTKYINEINIWYSDYMEFSSKLNPMAVRIMSKDLDKYEKSGQNYEYYSLKLLIDSEAITQYMSDNSINDNTVLSMDINNYEPLLNTLNETYAQYKIYSENKKGSIHLESLKDESAGFVDSANRIPKVVENQDLKAGSVYEPGVVASSMSTPIHDLNFYLERMISAYNSSIDFDYNNK